MFEIEWKEVEGTTPRYAERLLNIEEMGKGEKKKSSWKKREKSLTVKNGGANMVVTVWKGRIISGGKNKPNFENRIAENDKYLLIRRNER